jgi:hypothetical protein
VNRTGRKSLKSSGLQIIISKFQIKIMANPHHRKKHKSHLKQFQNRVAGNTDIPKAKAKASSVFAIGGAIAGLIVFYLATQGNFMWAGIGAVIGGVVGYLVGKNIDKGGKK